MTGADLSVAAATVLLLVLAVCVHEWAHAYATTWLGDDTAELQGRVTLNPLAHTDPVWTLLIPFLGLAFGGIFVGAGRPVAYNPRKWRPVLPTGHRLRKKWGEFTVAFAGPLSNIVQALVAGLLLGIAIRISGLSGAEIRMAVMSPETGSAATLVIWALYRMIYINALLAVFNLLPVAPLDGQKVLAPFLPEAWAHRLENLGSMGFLIVLLIVFRLPEVVSTPISLLQGLCVDLALLIGL